MSIFTPSLGLAVCLVGTLGSAMVSLLFRGSLSERVSLGLLLFSTSVGSVVGVYAAFGGGGEVILPWFAGAGEVQWLYGMIVGLDRLSGLFFMIVNAIAAVCAFFAIHYLEKYAFLFNLRLVGFLTAVFVFGMQGLLVSTNIVGFIISWEVFSLAFFFLLLSDRSQVSLEAAFKYLIISQMGTGAILAGFFVLSHGVLLVDFVSLASIAGGLGEPLILLSSALFLLGFGSKAGLIPFHGWLPRSLPQAPGHIAALGVGAMLSAAVYGFLRVTLFLLPGPLSWLGYGTIVVGLLGATIGALSASVEQDMKRLLAYVTIATSSFAFTMIGVGLVSSGEGLTVLSQAALFSALILVLSSACFSTGLFLSASAILHEVHEPNLEAMGGLAKRMPMFSVLFCVLVLAASGLPPFGPFIAEWLLVQAITDSLLSATPVFRVVLALELATMAFANGLALFTFVKLFAIAFLGRPRSASAEHAHEPFLGLTAPIAVLAFAVLAFGIFAPNVLALLDAINLVSLREGFPFGLRPSEETLEPSLLFLFGVGVVLLLVGVSFALLGKGKRRLAETWGGGETITARMEYTGAAFASPIRYFFKFFLKSGKALTITPLLPTNPWFTSRSFNLKLEPVWERVLYKPLQKAFVRGIFLLSQLQSGNVQIYVAMILLALTLSIVIAL